MRLPRGLNVTPVSSDPGCSGPVAVRNRATRRRGVIRPMSSSSVPLSSHTYRSPDAGRREVVHAGERRVGRDAPS